MTTGSSRANDLERWSQRLFDHSKDVRQEATSKLVEIANNDRTPLQARVLAALASRVAWLSNRGRDGSDSDDYELCYCLDSLNDLKGSLLFAHEPLWKAFIAVRSKDRDAMQRMLRTLWNAIDGCIVLPDSPVAKAIVDLALHAERGKMRNGRKEYLKICDWARDNALASPDVDAGAA